MTAGRAIPGIFLGGGGAGALGLGSGGAAFGVGAGETGPGVVLPPFRVSPLVVFPPMPSAFSLPASQLLLLFPPLPFSPERAYPRRLYPEPRKSQSNSRRLHTCFYTTFPFGTNEGLTFFRRHVVR